MQAKNRRSGMMTLGSEIASMYSARTFISVPSCSLSSSSFMLLTTEYTCLEGSAVDAAEATPHNKPLAGSTKTGEQRVTYASVAARGVAVGGGGGGGGTEAAEPPRPTKPASEAAMGDDANIQPVEPASASA
eukprot:scaffold81422_cov18-Tisochrysis_lutea.AAC.3